MSCEEYESVSVQGLPPLPSVSSYRQLYKLQVTLLKLGTVD